ncbi:MAG: tRNA (N6-threonylcarbamoyladenosine(37)-N6)-methyltransferase TrmO, partial [Thermodesulfobacteriota bacterium]
MDKFTINPVGFISSDIKTKSQAPKQGHEGEYKAWIEINPEFKDAAEDIIEGKEIIIITWLHKSDRDVLKVHPRGDRKNRLTGVFSTRSPDRPNPLGL